MHCSWFLHCICSQEHDWNNKYYPGLKDCCSDHLLHRIFLEIWWLFKWKGYKMLLFHWNIFIFIRKVSLTWNLDSLYWRNRKRKTFGVLNIIYRATKLGKYLNAPFLIFQECTQDFKRLFVKGKKCWHYWNIGILHFSCLEKIV